MYNFKRNLLVLLILFIGAHALLFAAGETGADFLKIGVGGRALGMAGAFTAVADDPSGTYWNPAGLATLRYKEFLLMHDEYLLGFNYDYIGYINPIGDNKSLGVETHFLHVNDIQGYDNTGAKQNKLSAYDGMISLALSRAFYNKKDRFYGFGGSIKVVQEKLVDEKAMAVTCDVGLLNQFYNKRISIGFALKNFLTPLKLKFISEDTPLPMEARLGVSYKWPFKNGHVLCAGDIVVPQKEITYSTFGIESVFWKYFTLRSGYRFGRDAGSGLSIGAGVIISMYKLNYAFIPFDELGDTHKISLGFTFGQPRKDMITMGDEEKAAIHYERAIAFKQDGDSIAAAYEFAVCLNYYPGYRDAQLLLNGEIRHFFAMGKQSFEEDNYADAIKWFELVIKYQPNNTEAKQLLKEAEERHNE
ncbi:MAG: PorV/PorQ family protein [Elusimicrobia bacterium]|nr:PorV/PorQ family protein [Elusimicrobiota bacterium]MBD3411688.1 PorV/PorQ family protein [Elusimicrobiota bacterium]